MEEGAGMAPRRSKPVDPQIQPSADGAGVSMCLHPQIQASEEDAGVTRCCNPRLHPQIEAIEEGAEVSHGREGNLPAAPASLPDDDDMLREILLRLPPQPSSLPRASAVCRRWRRIVADPKFQRQFRVHHRKPPLLGVFQDSGIKGIMFTPVLDPPDRVPPQRFSLGRCSSSLHYDLLDCRRGLVLVKNQMRKRNEVVVCDPITGKQRRVSIPMEFRRGFLSGTVLRAAGDSSIFKVVLVIMHSEDNQFLLRVYSSETGIWGNLISTAAPCELCDGSATLVGNALYWLSEGDQILVFDLDEQSLSVIRVPPHRNDIIYGNRQIVRGEDGAVGFATLSRPCLQTWQRNVNRHGIATWVPWKTIEMHTVLGLPSSMEGVWGRLVGYGEDNDLMLLYVKGSVYTVQLMSMQSRKLYNAHNMRNCHPFTSFFTPESSSGGGHDAAGPSYNT